MEPRSALGDSLSKPVSLWRAGALIFGAFIAVVALVGGADGRTSSSARPVPPVGLAASSTEAAPAVSPPPAAKEATPAVAENLPVPSGHTYYPVTQVVDGDTFKIQKDDAEVTLRLIGIDTPETVDPRKPVQCFGREASAEAKRLLVGQKVRIEADASQGTYDKYGRTLAYAYLEDGTSFNEHMVRQGFAHEYTYDAPYKYQATFRAAQREAEAAGRGLWAAGACADNTASAPAPDPTPEAAPAASGHTFYTSSYHTAKFYYCDSDDGWRSLSEKYLRSYPSAGELLAAFPDRTLHEDCR